MPSCCLSFQSCFGIDFTRSSLNISVQRCARDLRCCVPALNRACPLSAGCSPGPGLCARLPLDASFKFALAQLVVERRIFLWPQCSSWALCCQKDVHHIVDELKLRHLNCSLDCGPDTRSRESVHLDGNVRESARNFSVAPLYKMTCSARCQPSLLKLLASCR